MSDSLQPHGLWPIGLFHPWDFPGKSARVDCHFLLQGIFPTRRSNPGLLHCRQTLYRLSHQESPNSTKQYHICEFISSKNPIEANEFYNAMKLLCKKAVFTTELLCVDLNNKSCLKQDLLLSILLESELGLINKQCYETKRVLLTLRIQRTGLLAE